MKQTIVIKRSSVAGRIPSELQAGELAVNLADNLLYTADTSGNIITLNAASTPGNSALKVASGSGTTTEVITMNEGTADKTLTVTGDGTYLTGAVSGSAGAPTVTISHADPTADPSSEITAAISGSAGEYAKDTEYTVLTGVKAQRDAKGHITGLTYSAQKVKDTNTEYTKGSSSDLNTGTDRTGKIWDAKTISDFVGESMANATRFRGGFNAETGAIDGGETTLTSVEEKIGDVYVATTAGTFVGTAMEVGDSIIFKKSCSAGTAPTSDHIIFVEGTVSVDNKDTMLAWGTATTVATVEGTDITVSLPANPNTDTKVTSVSNHYTPSGGTTKSASGASGASGATVQVVTGVTCDAAGHVTGITSGAATDSSVTSVNNHYTPTGTSTKSASGASGTSGSTVQVVTGVTVDAAGHVTGITSGAATDTTYESKTAASGGTDKSLVTTGEKYTWNNKSNLTLGNTASTALAGNTKYAGSSTQGGAATSAEKLTNTSNIGNTNQPVYFTTGGVPTAISYTINKSVPSNAVFTDTHYTTHLYAGSGTAANAATTNGNTKLTVVDNTTPRDSVTIKGTGGTTVTSDANGVVTINSTDVKVRQTLTLANWNLPLLMGYQYNTVTTTDVDNITYRNNSIYANPAEGTITAKLKGNIYGQFLRQADVETVSAARYVYVKLGTFDYNSFGTLCVHLEGNLFKDELYINYGSGNAYSPVVCGWYASHAGNVKEIDLVYGTSWNGDCELWLNVYQSSILNIAVLRAIRGDGFTVNTAANWSATTTSPTFNKKVPLIRGMFGDLSGNASSASKLTTNAGSATQPVYFSGGVPTACSYQLNKTVPSNAVFTDTTYSSKSEASGGTDVSLVTTGEKYTWNHKSNLALGNTSSTALAGNTKYAGSSTQGGAATSAEKLTNTSNIGNTNQPVYFTTGGVPTAISYTINKSVPSNAVFTDTTYAKGTSSNLVTGTDQTGKVWDAKTISDYVGSMVTNATHFKGGFNASTGAIDGGSSTMTSVAEKIGDVYTVTTAGTFAGTAMEVGDSIIFKADCAAGTAPTSSYVIFVEGTVSVVNKGATLAWGKSTTVATVEGTNINVSLPGNPNTDTKVTSVSNHYTPSGGTTKSASGASGTSGTTVQVVTGVTCDAAGHVTGITSGAATDTTYSSKSEASGGTDVSLVTTGEKYTWNHKSNLTLGNTASTALAGNTKYAGSSTQGGAATSAEKLTNTSNIGNTNQPVYFTTGGVPTAISYTIDKSVPSNAVFTDTNTKVTSAANHYAPAEDTSSQLDADASSTTAATWNSTSLVTGVTVKRDSKGHVVGLGVDSIKMPGNPNTDTKVTSTANHYTPATVSGQDKSASASGGTAGWSIDVVKGVTLNTDGKGHVTGLSVTSAKIPGNPNTDRYVNSASFADDSTSTPASPVKMTLKRAGSDTTAVTANIPKVSSASAGVAPKGAAVTTQSQSTKFLREDGTWAAPSYTKPGGNVTGPSSSTDAHVAVFNGTTGKVIKDSGFTIAKSVPSNAVFTDTTYSSKSEANGGTDVSLVTTGEKYNWNRKSNLVLGNTSYTALAGNTKYAGSSTQGGAATSAEKLTNTSNIGNTNQPVYFTTGGVPTAISYTINKSVPSNAVFTDTHYTTHLYAGSGTAANAATSNGNTKLTVVDNTTTRNSVTIKGTGETTVTSNADGVVFINSVNKTSKLFNFPSPSKVDNAFYFIISPRGGSTVTPNGTCYSIEINAVVQSSPGNYIISNTKFVTFCYWYASNAGLRLTYPVYSNSRIPIYYHGKAEGAGIGNETRSSNVCNIPIKVENVSSLMAVDIKVEGPGVSDCICTRSYSSYNWGQDEPTSWSSI